MSTPYTAMESRSHQVPYSASESYSCGYGTSHRTCTRSVTRYRTEYRTESVTRHRIETRFRTVTRHRTETKYRMVSRSVKVTDATCAAENGLSAHENGVYLLEFNFQDSGACRLSCFEQVPEPDGNFRNQPCPPLQVR